MAVAIESCIISERKANIASLMRELIADLVLDPGFANFGYIKAVMDSIEKVTGVAAVPHQENFGDYINAQVGGIGLGGRNVDAQDAVLAMVEAIKSANKTGEKIVDQAQTMLDLAKNPDVSDDIRQKLIRDANALLANMSIDKPQDLAIEDAEPLLEKER